MELTMKLWILIIVSVIMLSCEENNINSNEEIGTIDGVIKYLDQDTVDLTNFIVSSVPPTEVVLTDHLGRFELRHALEGSYRIRAFRGADTGIVHVNVVPNKTTFATIVIGHKEEDYRPVR